ncbi:MAG: plastocyanin/azurin family copper-binding protein [Bradymonadaceae bacterium]
MSTTHRLSATLAALLVGVASMAATPRTASAGDGDDVDQKIVLKPIGNQMKYATTELEAKAGSTVKVVFKNTADSSAMHHNFTLLKPDANITSVGAAAAKAGPDNGYIPDHEAILANTDMAEPGESQSVTFTVPSEPGDYPYICLYPGHYTQMQGTLTVTE